MKKVLVSISTGKSRDLIKKAKRAEKNNEDVDWEKVFVKVHEAEARGKDQQLKAIMEKK